MCLCPHLYRIISGYIITLLFLLQNFFLPARFKRKIKTEEERKADMIAAEKREEELQAARMRELFGDPTPEPIVDIEPKALEPVKQVSAGG